MARFRLPAPALSPGLCARLAASALVAGCGVTPAPRPAQPAIQDVRASPVKTDSDPDRDGISSLEDLCPTEPEDVDRFEDEDGCPDPDNDHDRILDASDKCPDEPENYNAYADDDGCPDRLGIVFVDPVDVADRIAFATGSATLLPAGEPVTAIAALLAGNPQVGPLHIRGHATSREKFRAALAKQRAVAVRDALIAAGADASRLVIDLVPPAKTDKPEVDFHLEP